jgi:hypothetical protein
MGTSSRSGSVSEKHTAARPIWRRFWPWALLVLILTWWGLLWSQLDRSVLTRVPILDEAFYLEEGAAIAGGRLLPEQSFIMSPLYPYLVAVTGSGRQVYATGVRMGAPPVGLRLLQLACWCGILWLLWQAGRRLLPAWAAILPPVMFALYPSVTAPGRSGGARSWRVCCSERPHSCEHRACSCGCRACSPGTVHPTGAGRWPF